MILFYLHLVTMVAAAQPVVSADEVLAMMARVPATQRERDEALPGHWERRKDAPRIAAAIARFAPSEEVAARLTVYAALEGGMEVHGPRGDSGKAMGMLQLHNVPESLAFDPNQAIPWWLDLAARSEKLCQSNPPRERLAALASGRCDRGRRLVARREDIVDLVLGRRAPGESSKQAEAATEAFGRE